MKNNNDTQTKMAQQGRHYALHTDMLVRPDVVKHNKAKLNKKPQRKKRRINYAKKIANDDFIFNV